MSQHPLFDLCQNFRLLKLHVTVRLEQDAYLPAFKGSLLHGWFGQALKACDPHSYHILYGEHANQQPKPYALCPNADHKTNWRQGELYSFELTLFGEAVGLYPRVLDALQHGERLGWGKNHIPVKLISLSSITPYGLKAGICVSHLSDWLPLVASESASEVAIEFITPVRLKHHGKLILELIEDIPYWLNHILRRLKQLTTFWVCDNPELIDSLYHAAQVNPGWQVQSSSYYEDWQRYSAKHQKLLPFGGVKGQLNFSGAIAPLVPWLAIGEQLQIGGKSTFGLGKYRMIQPG